MNQPDHLNNIGSACINPTEEKKIGKEKREEKLKLFAVGHLKEISDDVIKWAWLDLINH